MEASTKRKMIRIAGEVILLTDHSKIGKVAYAKFADISDIHHCIIDQGVRTDFVNELKKLEVDVTLASE
ncbi:DNA-binding transcriptional regulator AgaR [compost metagenome]